jgi:pimeloyl-ACP methyl ester carboxylesterase
MMGSDVSFEPVIDTVEIAGRSLTVAQFGPSPSSIVMLHDGLGSVSQWRDVPARIAHSTGVGVLVYDRAGHGKSRPAVPATADWLHKEAEVLELLLKHYEIKQPLVVGHSDGGSIALIYGASGGACQAILTLAAHSFVEEVCVAKITALRTAPGPITIGLARHHESPAELFNSWSGVWVDPQFSRWDLRPQLHQLDCPVLVVQGDADDFATDAQLTETASSIGENATTMSLAGFGHVLHHEAPERVIEIVSDFYRSLN